MQDEHETAQAQHATLVDQARNVVDLSRRARILQAAALEQLRRKADKAKRRALATDQLRAENRLLMHELQEQRTYFQRQIADLKAMLTKAADQVKNLLAKVGLITRQRDDAEAEAE
jgi:hypothetical protein